METPVLEGEADCTSAPAVSTSDPLEPGFRLHRYQAFGLTLASTLPLPELPPDLEPGGEGEVSIRLGPLADAPLDIQEDGKFIRTNPQLTYFHWDRFGTFQVRDGREITVEPAPEAAIEGLRLLILGPAMAMLLHQRGKLVLHGSAVAFPHEKGARVFLGESGAGKSTLAASLHAMGCRVLTDDLAILHCDGGVPSLIPGYPGIKLRWDAAERLISSPEPLSYPSTSDPRHFLSAQPGFSNNSLPLEKIYLLTEGPNLRFERLPAQEVFWEIMRHTYCSSVLNAADLVPHFKQVSQVLQSVPVYRLSRPHDFQQLPRLIEQLRAHTD